MRDQSGAAAGAMQEGRAPCPLFISGHSLGGAIASVFAQALAVQASPASPISALKCSGLNINQQGTPVILLDAFGGHMPYGLE